MEIKAPGFRISLKTISSEDAEDISSNASDPEITRNVARMGEFPFPYTAEQARSFISSLQEKQAEGSESHFGIRLDGRTIGACALMNIDLQSKHAELGYWLGRRYWGMGYAKEALRLLLAFAFMRLGLETISARTFNSNERSIGLLDSLGFSKEAQGSNGARSDEIEYSISKREFSIIPGFEIVEE